MELKRDHLRRVAIGPTRVAMSFRRGQAGGKPQLVELEIDVSGADGEYEGRYVAIVHDGQRPKVKLAGAIACGAD